MLSTISRRRSESESGFTLIELLIVMIIIAILMAIAIPIFMGQKDKAVATGAKAHARMTQTTIESCVAAQLDTDDYAMCAIEATIGNEEPSLMGPLAASIVVTGAAGGYTILSSALRGGTSIGTFTIMKTTSTQARTCTQVAPHRICPTGMW